MCEFISICDELANIIKKEENFKEIWSKCANTQLKNYIKYTNLTFGAKMDRINTWVLDLWKLTFVIPRFLVVKRSIRCPSSGFRWRISDDPLGYRKLHNKEETRERNLLLNTLEAQFSTCEYYPRLVPARC